MKTFSKPLVIQGFGLATGVGKTSQITLEALNSEKSAFRGHKRFFDASYNPLVCAFAQQDTLVGFTERTIALAKLAIDDCFANHGDGQAIDLHIVLPNPNPASGLQPQDVAQVEIEITALVQQRLGKDMISTRSYLEGQGGLGMALAQASHSGTLTSLIVSADSFCDRRRLDISLINGRLMSQKTPWGFIPGEAAGAMLVAKTGSGPTINGVGLSREPITEENETAESDFAAISFAVRDACADIADQKIRHWVSDANNSRYRASEVAHAILRATPFWLEADLEPTFPAGDLGDCGTTAGLIGIFLALNAKGELTMITMGSQNGIRCAITLSV